MVTSVSEEPQVGHGLSRQHVVACPTLRWEARGPPARPRARPRAVRSPGRLGWSSGMRAARPPALSLQHVSRARLL